MNSTVKSILFLLTLAVCGSLFLSSCSQKSGDRGALQAGTVYLKADVSLRLAMMELAQKYQQETSIRVKMKFVPSQEIKLNASDSIDVYILANDLTSTTLLDTTTYDPLSKRTLAYAIPCIVIPQFNPAMISALGDLKERNVRVGIADPNKDVLGQFAVEILQKNHIYDAISDRLIIATSAQDLAERVARKDLDAAIGWSNFPAWTQGGTDVVLLGASEIPRIAAICAYRAETCIDLGQALKFMGYLGSDRALDVLHKWGYLISKADLELYATVAKIGGKPE